MKEESTPVLQALEMIDLVPHEFRLPFMLSHIQRSIDSMNGRLRLARIVPERYPTISHSNCGSWLEKLRRGLNQDADAKTPIPCTSSPRLGLFARLHWVAGDEKDLLQPPGRPEDKGLSPRKHLRHGAPPCSFQAQSSLCRSISEFQFMELGFAGFVTHEIASYGTAPVVIAMPLCLMCHQHQQISHFLKDFPSYMPPTPTKICHFLQSCLPSSQI